MGGSVFIRPAHLGDVKALARTLRLADRKELAASHPGIAVEKCLAHFCEVSLQCVCLGTDCERLALAGIYTPIALGSYACVWLLTGEGIERYKWSFVRLAKKQLARWLGMYPILGNEVDARYQAAQRFIKHLGGNIHHPVVWKGKIPFLYFTFRRNPWEEL